MTAKIRERDVPLTIMLLFSLSGVKTRGGGGHGGGGGGGGGGAKNGATGIPEPAISTFSLFMFAADNCLSRSFFSANRREYLLPFVSTK